MISYSADNLLNLNRERIHKNKDYSWVRLYIQDKQLFNDKHSSAVRLAGKCYRSGIFHGEMSEGDREFVFHFLMHHSTTIVDFNQMISKIHNEIMINKSVSISPNIVACVIMELYMDDILDAQRIVSQYITIANKIVPNHIWRFADPQEFEEYHIDMMEEHHNGVPVAAYQVKCDIKYYEWMADPMKNAGRDWVREQYDQNLYHVVNYMKDYEIPMYFLVSSNHGIKADQAIICGKLEPNGDYEIGKQIPRDVFKKSRAALL